MKYKILFLLIIAGFGSFIVLALSKNSAVPLNGQFINPAGKTICERIIVPPGFQRVELDTNFFGAYLRKLSLKPHGSKVMHYNGSEKMTDVHVAVVDLPIGKRDLHQCADAVMHLRARYFYQQMQYDSIHFNFTNGFNATFAKWRQGYRIVVNGNKASWVLKAAPSVNEIVFAQYLEMVYTYAGTLSLAKELKQVVFANMQIGDVLIQGGSPGHAVIVVDMAVNKQTGKKIFLIAQSYMPAQELHVLKNTENLLLSPWYELKEKTAIIITPEWTFKSIDLKRF